MGRKIKATVIAVAIVGGTVLTPAVAEASSAKVAAGPALTCVETSFWGRALSLFVSRSYAAYLWQVKC